MVDRLDSLIVLRALKTILFHSIIFAAWQGGGKLSGQLHHVVFPPPTISFVINANKRSLLEN